MAKSRKSTGGPRPPEADAGKLQRMQFELALELGDTGEVAAGDLLRQAAEAVGGDIVFLLPGPDGKGMSAVVRMPGVDGKDSFLQVRKADTGFSVSDEAEIDPGLLGFARASVDVLERLRADRKILDPLAASAH